MIQCSLSFLKCDVRLIDDLMKITFSTTHLTEINEIYSALEALKRWFGFIKESKLTIPTLKFDVKFFLEGFFFFIFLFFIFIFYFLFLAFKLILELEHQGLICKFLTILYDNYEIFCPRNIKKIFYNFILCDHFYYFALNWCENVRCTFAQLLIFRVK
jgi:hypothetical protein